MDKMHRMLPNCWSAFNPKSICPFDDHPIDCARTTISLAAHPTRSLSHSNALIPYSLCAIAPRTSTQEDHPTAIEGESRVINKLDHYSIAVPSHSPNDSTDWTYRIDGQCD